MAPPPHLDTIKDAISNILDEMDREGITDVHERAYILATAQIEGGMGVNMYEFGGYTEEQRINYFSNYDGLLGNGPNEGYIYRGRGLVQVTGKANYATWSKILGLDLVSNPDLAVDPKVSVKILVYGIHNGKFAPRWGTPSDYYLPSGDFNYQDARKIVRPNGTIKDDIEFAKLAKEYEGALKNLGVKTGK